MTKTYKHRTMWRTTKKEEVDGLYSIQINWTNYYLSKEVIDVCIADREEVVEKDWVEKCVDEIFEYQRWRPWDEPDYVSIRKIIEKHAPQTINLVRKKITDQDIAEFMKSTKVLMMPEYSMWVKPIKEAIEKYIIIFLKEHNLLSSDE